jgi:hypothetical protein
MTEGRLRPRKDGAIERGSEGWRLIVKEPGEAIMTGLDNKGPAKGETGSTAESSIAAGGPKWNILGKHMVPRGTPLREVVTKHEYANEI